MSLRLATLSDSVFVGKYRLSSHDRLEPLLVALKVGWLSRKRLLMSHPCLTIRAGSRNGSLLLSGDDFGRHETLFVLGEESEEVLPNGHMVKCVTVREGDATLISRASPPSNLEIRRDFNDAGIKEVMRLPDLAIEVVRYFKRL